MLCVCFLVYYLDREWLCLLALMVLFERLNALAFIDLFDGDRILIEAEFWM